jgi:hypothetical protein
MILVSYYETGARDTMWVPMMSFLEMVIIASLSIAYGVGGWGRLEKFCFLGAVVGSVLWAVFDSPTIALIAYLVIDFSGVVPTVQKSYQMPKTENRLGWEISVLASIANIVALGSIGTWTLGIAIYPIYMFMTSGLIFGILLDPNKRVSHIFRRHKTSLVA